LHNPKQLEAVPNVAMSCHQTNSRTCTFHYSTKGICAAAGPTPLSAAGSRPLVAPVVEPLRIPPRSTGVAGPQF